jgi:hypothetical protein
MEREKTSWNLSNQAQEFFVYATLGIVPKSMFCKDKYKTCLGLENDDFDYEYYCIYQCAKSAYNDLARTLRYADDYKSDSKSKDKIQEKENAIKNVCIELTDEIYNNGNFKESPETLFKLFIDTDKYNTIKENFNLLKYLKSSNSESDKFFFGQAQKWVNMTLKYLYLLGYIKNPTSLHIPIDSYILKALKDSKIELENEKTWSKFDYNDYNNLVKNYSEKIKLPYISWEHENWIKMAEKEKGINL